MSFRTDDCMGFYTTKHLQIHCPGVKRDKRKTETPNSRYLYNDSKNLKFKTRRIFTCFIKFTISNIIKYTIIYKDYIHFAQTFTSQYIVSIRNIVYIYHQTTKPNDSSVTAPVSTDSFFINYIIRKYTAVNWAFKNVFYKI